jgi:serine protease Do
MVLGAVLVASARADELGERLARMIGEHERSLVQVSFEVEVSNPFAGFGAMGGGRGARPGGSGDDEGGRRSWRDRRGSGGGGGETMQETGVGVLLDDQGHVLMARFQAPTIFGMSGGDSQKRGLAVTLGDGTQVEAEMVGTDEGLGLSVIRFDPAGLDLQPIARSRTGRVSMGDPVVVLGLLDASLGRGPTYRLTRVAGVIEGDRACMVTHDTVDDMIASPVLAEDGSLVGFIAPWRSEGEQQGGGFSMRGITRLLQGRGGGDLVARGVIVGLDRCQSILDDPASVGSGERGVHHGISVRAMGAAERGFYGGLEEHPGCVIVETVAEGSPAATAGIEPGDVLVAVGGKPVEVNRVGDEGRFDTLFAGRAPGDRVEVTGFRDGESRSFELVLVDAPTSWENAPTDGDSRYGVTTRELTDDYVRERGLPAGTRGVVVTQADPGGAAATAGLVSGDVIVSANGQAVESLSVWKRALATGGSLALEYLRNGQRQTATMTPGR